MKHIVIRKLPVLPVLPVVEKIVLEVSLAELTLLKDIVGRSCDGLAGACLHEGLARAEANAR